jgi:ribosomal-protein-alanine N-acetyltransferase
MSPEALARIHAASFALPPPWAAREFEGFLTDPTCFLETVHEGLTLVGFALFRVAADQAELLTLAVAPDARRQGHARNLVVRGLVQAQARGAQSCFLEVAANNDAAMALYRATGFVEVGRRAGYYRGAGHASVDALVLEAVLT